MYALHIIFVCLAIVCLVVLMFLDNKNVSCDISIPLIILFAFLLVSGLVTGICTNDTCHYRENHEPTFEDYQEGKAEIKTYVNEIDNDTIFIIEWKGRQEGER